MAKIEEYASIVGGAVIDDLRLLADRLKGKTIQHINSTLVGGGVAEILGRMIPLLQELAVDARWDVIKGGERFFAVTKKFHNALHGRQEEISDEDFDVFRQISDENIREINTSFDIVFVHDPQPIALIKKKADNKWIWRCHIDLSRANKRVWEFLMGYLPRYDSAVFSAPSFSRKLPLRQFLISPSIDPLSDKNKELPQDLIENVLRKYDIPMDKPIVTQISRFDRLKDPLGVIDAYLLVRKSVDCRLILAGGLAADDPEGVKVVEEAREKAKKGNDIHILLLPQDDIEINALQRASTVIIQKSIRQGFCLTVSEALWKAKPVVASNLGGIPLQEKQKNIRILFYFFLW